MLALGFAAFLLFGVVLVLPGASQDALAAALQLDLARSGLVASVLSLGIGLGNLVAGPLVDRFPRRPLFLVSALTVALPLLLADAGLGFGALLVQVGLAGFGGGVYDILLNVVAVERYGERAAQRVSLLHAAATLGAVLGPPLVIALGAKGDFALSFRVTGAAYLALSAWVAAVPLRTPYELASAPKARAQRGAAGRSRPEGARGVVSRELAALCAVAFAYLGVEAGVTIFAVPYASEAIGLAADRGRSAISAFWLGLLLGRLALLLHPGRPDARLLAGAGAAGGVALALGVGLGTRGIEWLTGAVGLGLGSVFPLMVTLAAQSAPRAPGAATGAVAGIGALGGFVVPWLTGRLGDLAGMRLALGSLAVWCFVLAVAAVLARRSAQR